MVNQFPNKKEFYQTNATIEEKKNLLCMRHAFLNAIVTNCLDP